MQNRSANSFANHQALWIKTAIVLVVSVLFTLFCVSTSKQKGRLLSAPNYDDVVYFNQGSQLLQTLNQQGIVGVWQFLEEKGLHSPYSVTLAAAAYAIGGFGEPAPYYANILVVVVYLSGLSWFLRALPLMQWLASIALFMVLPFITMGVVEFRPDIMWAVVTGFGVVYLATTPGVLVSVGPAVTSGVLLGLSLIIKPSTFAMTLILYGCAGLVRFLWERKTKQLAVGLSIFMVAILLTAGPYWWFFGEQAWSYFWKNSFGANKQVWVFQGSLTDFLSFYITGDGWKSNVGIPGTILTIFTIVCGVFDWKTAPIHRRHLTLLASVLATAVFINTSASMKSPFLGGGIYGVWLFSCAYVIGRCATTGCWPFDFTWRKWTFNVLLIAALAGVLTYRWPRYSDWGRDRAGAAFCREANDRVLNLLEKKRDNLPSSILFMQAGPIIPEFVHMWFTVNGFKVEIARGAMMRKVSDLTDAYQRYAWVVIQDENVKGSIPNMPSESILTEGINTLLADKNIYIIDLFEDNNAKTIYIIKTNTVL